MPGGELSALRVIHVVPSLHVSGGGPARSVMRLASAQQQLGASVCVVTGNRPHSGEDAGTGNFAPELQIRRCGHLPLPFELPGLGMLRVLEEEISQADLVHLHSLWNGTITAAARIARHTGVPYVISPRGMLDPTAVRQRRALKRLYRKLVDQSTSEGAAGFHFLTSDERGTAVWPPRVGQRTAVIPNGIDVEAVQRAAEAFSPSLFAGGSPNLLFLGRLHSTKGLGLQLDALRQLKDRGVEARLFFVGPDDGEAVSLKQRAAALGVGDQTRILAPVYSDERFALLRAADGVLLTSHFEGNSVSAMETMAVGGLLVATDTTHLDDAAQHDAAIVVERKACAVADAVIRILENPELARSLRVQAVEYARSALGSAVIARRMLAFYNEVLAISFAARASA